MRELKFRAWDKIDKKIIQPNGGDFIAWHAMSNWRDCLDVMQFTGCKDFFGTDIFDGDIVFLDSKMMIGKIESDGISWRIKFENDLDWLCDYYEDLHVIGNIYQNPELLENKNENNTNK